MPDISYTDATHLDIGVLKGARLDLEYGDTGNDFELTLDIDSEQRLDNGAYVYVEGTEWGGVVDARESNSGNNTITYIGRSWQGIIRDKVLEPPSGEDYLSVRGEAHVVLKQLVQRLGLASQFKVSEETSGITVKYTFDRYCDAWTGIRKMLADSSSRLNIEYDSIERMIVLSVKPITDWTDGADAEHSDVAIKSVVRPYNHLICLGSGELKNRIVMHFYADARGNISTTQTLFGIDERTTTYNYTNASREELEKDGPKKLKEYQAADSINVTLDDDEEFGIGDIVPGIDPVTGLHVTATVGTKVIIVTDTQVSISYKVGGTASNTSSSGTAEHGSSTGSGAVSSSYTAGTGISIAGRTISAEVSRADFKSLENKVNEARKVATDSASEIGRATLQVDSKVAEVTATTPLKAQRTGGTVALSHEPSRVTAGVYGSESDVDASWGDTVQLGSTVNVDALGHVTDAQTHTVKLPAKPTYTAQEVGAAPASHTHPYAGASTPGGDANAAKKLSQPRTIKLVGSVSGTAVFDGSSDVTINVQGATQGGAATPSFPVGSVIETTSFVNPATNYGGRWQQLPSLGCYKWERTA